MRRKETTDLQYAEDKKQIFSFDLKEESKEECLTQRVPDPSYDVLKRSIPQGPPANPWYTEDPSIRG